MAAGDLAEDGAPVVGEDAVHEVIPVVVRDTGAAGDEPTRRAMDALLDVVRTGDEKAAKALAAAAAEKDAALAKAHEKKAAALPEATSEKPASQTQEK